MNPKPELLQDMIYSAVVTAFEGGSNYWVSRANPVSGFEGLAGSGLVWWGHKNRYSPGMEIEIEFDNPDDMDSTLVRRFRYEDFVKALDVMLEKYPQHFADLLRGTDDATTGDVYLQCLIFQEVVYG